MTLEEQLRATQRTLHDERERGTQYLLVARRLLTVARNLRRICEREELAVPANSALLDEIAEKNPWLNDE